jgi:SAM-dependent methyltransferase
MFRCKYLDPQFTDHSGYYILKAVGKSDGYSRWILDQVKPFLGQRLFEAGAGIGNLSQELLKRERLVLVDYEEMYVNTLQRRYTGRRNVRVDRCDLTDASTFERWYDERLDTIFCSNVLEHLEPDEQVLKSYYDLLVPGGHCIIVVPARPELYNGIDKALGHCRRYTEQELVEKMQRAGFELAFVKQFSRLGAIAWNVSGKLGRTEISPFQMTTFNRILPIAKAMDYLLPIKGMSLICVGRKPKVGMHSGGDTPAAYTIPSNLSAVKSA